MKSTDFGKLLARARRAAGEEVVRATLESLGRKRDIGRVLTIVTNVGVHPIPNEWMRGEIFIASRGHLGLGSPVLARRNIKKVLRRLAKKLQEQRYDRIYLLPFSHTVLNMQIKLLVYRIAHIETVDIFHLGGSRYFEFVMSLRKVAAEVQNRTSKTRK